jgi:hypothetical protein
MAQETKTSNSVLNIDGAGLTAPAADVIKCMFGVCQDAIGGIFRPLQIVRVAKAEAKARRIQTREEAAGKKIMAKAEIEVSQLQDKAQGKRLIKDAAKRRKLAASGTAPTLLTGAAAPLPPLEDRAQDRARVENEEDQHNMESVFGMSLQELKPTADPAKIERDWLKHLFHRARRTSNPDIQKMWARLLAGEANNPGEFSKVTVNTVELLTAADARAFQKLCRLRWTFHHSDVEHRLVIPHPKASDAEGHGFTRKRLRALEELGLIKFGHAKGYAIELKTGGVTESQFICTHDRKTYKLKLPSGKKEIQLGCVNFTASGEQVARLCEGDYGSEIDHSYFADVKQLWETEQVEIVEIN